MTHPIQIRNACPKRWDDLQGDERRRFCSECSLHVHNSAALTQREAQALVARAEGRVCMRIEYDRCGAPVFREARVARLARWALSAGAALLAACQGGRPTAPPAPPQPIQPRSLTGEVQAPHELGDVALPQAQGLELMGKVAPAKPK